MRTRKPVRSDGVSWTPERYAPAMKRVLLLVLVTACGGNDGGSSAIDAAPLSDGAADAPSTVDAPAGALTLTSPSLTEGAAFDAANTCNGANTSPQLDWTAAPAGTQSFAIVLTDKSFNNLVHWVIYDIPSTVTGLPANVENSFAPGSVAGAHQTESYQTQVRGYLGPCPPAQHTYEFKLFALDVATLPGATIQTTRAQALALIGQHDLASATLIGTHAP